MKNSIMPKEVTSPALELPMMNLNTNQIMNVIKTEKNNGSVIFSIGSSWMLFWNKNMIGIKENKNGWNINLLSNI